MLHVPGKFNNMIVIVYYMYMYLYLFSDAAAVFQDFKLVLVYF